jgi:hypothetical protein
MPLGTAQIGDTVQYRNARGSTRDVIVVQTQLAAPAGGDWSVANSGTGGTLGAATYSYRIAKVRNGVVGVAATAKTTVVGAGTTNKCTVTLPTDVGTNGISYNIYGRTGAAELLIAAGVTTATYDDTGALTPAGALPANDGRIGVAAYTGGVPSASLVNVVKATTVKSTNAYMKR